jgi:ketosteroid isomerase-like protein
MLSGAIDQRCQAMFSVWRSVDIKIKTIICISFYDLIKGVFMFKNLLIIVLCFQGLHGPLSAMDTETDKEKVLQRLQDFTIAINQGNENVLPSFLTEDAEVYNPITGEILEGKVDIGKLLQQRANEIKQRQLTFSFKAEKIDFPNPDLARIDGISEISDKGALLQRNARRVELVKENGQWFIDTIREIEVAPAPPVYGHLKGLEWLIGKWKDKDDEVTITFEAQWDKFKNFIVQKFKMEVFGTVEMEGLQIIGWDPIEQKIRSWVYDSDGGFGTGVWSKSGNSWNAVLSYVLSDGKKASATYSYTEINDKSYSFTAINRTINNEVLPNIEPVTVVREE